MRSSVVVAVLVSAVCVHGVAHAQVLPLPADDQKRITKLLGDGIVGQALASAPIADPSVYFPLIERTRVFNVTSGKNAGQQQTLHVAKGQRPNGNPAWRFEMSPSLFGFINKSDGGDLNMPAVSDTSEGVVVVTTPANPFVLTGMQPGETRSLAQKVSVNYLDDPTDQRYSGSLSGTYTYVGTYQLTVPAGMYPAILMRVNLSGKIGPAHTDDTAYYFFAPNIGVVAMISQEDVEAFWIIHIDSSTGKVLASS